MTHFAKIPAGLLAAALLAAGCSSSDSGPPAAPAPAATTQLRFIHASPDAPDVNIGATGRTYALGLGYKQATPFTTTTPETIGNLRVDGIVPGGTVTVIGPVDVTLAADTEYSVLAVGPVASIGALVIAEPATPVPAGQVRVQVVHGAPNAPAVDVHVTAPDAMLDSSTALGSFAFGEDLGPVEVPAGTYRIRVTPAGTADPVVFDSGAVDLPARAGLLVVAVENTGAGDAPISLLVHTGSSTFEILDADTPAEVRVIHASPDAPAVDVYVDGTQVLADVPYPAFSGYLPVPPGTYNVVVTPAGNPGVNVIDVDLTVEAGVQYSVFATGLVADIAPYVLVDDNRAVATEAKVRIAHLAPGAPLVDIYVTAEGADISTLAPTFAGVDFLDETGYVSVPGGVYDVTVTLAGTKTAAIGPATIEILDGGVYTATARDAAGGGAPFGLILLDDFNP
jgi:hypothetical protein